MNLAALLKPRLIVHGGTERNPDGRPFYAKPKTNCEAALMCMGQANKLDFTMNSPFADVPMRCAVFAPDPNDKWVVHATIKGTDYIVAGLKKARDSGSLSDLVHGFFTDEKTMHNVILAASYDALMCAAVLSSIAADEFAFCDGCFGHLFQEEHAEDALAMAAEGLQEFVRAVHSDNAVTNG